LNKAVVDSLDYLPYGMQIAGGTFTTHKFTGKERDAESGLDHFDFRKYNSALGRWMSPDPAGAAFASPSVPQTWNLYSYVLNNPLQFTDPTGLYCYYGDTGDDGWSVADFNHSDNFDFQSNVKECNENGGVWHPLETDIQSITVTDTSGFDFNGGGGGGGRTIEDDRANALANAIKKTGVQALTNPCTPATFYIASGIVAAGKSLVVGELGVLAAETALENLPQGAAWDFVYKQALTGAPVSNFLLNIRQKFNNAKNFVSNGCNALQGK
jgi:RHS repeat-associated protein